MKQFLRKLNIHPLLLMGLLTLTLFPLLAWGITWLKGDSFIQLFTLNLADAIYIPAFISFGVIFGLFVIWMSELNYFEPSLSKYKNLLEQYSLTHFYVIFLSLSAGFGEEIFFRGEIQPLIGIIPTAIIFVAIHGYFSIKDFRVNIFAILLTIFICGLGWPLKTTVYG